MNTSNTDSNPNAALRLVIHGCVQGVFFRDSMRRKAVELDVRGWVRNRDDGTVEAVVQGSIAAVEAIVQWAHHGPAHARVERVDCELTTGSFNQFEILY